MLSIKEARHCSESEEAAAWGVASRNII